jgi:hypothetical protein
MTVVHRSRRMNIAPDYFSKLGAEFHFDPLLNKYLKIAESNRTDDPPTATGPNIQDENLPNFRGTRPATTANPSRSAHSNLVFAKYESINNATITNVPINFGVDDNNAPTKTFHQSACGHAAFQLLNQTWVLYGFTSGHFFSTTKSLAENIKVHLAADPNKRGRAFLDSFGHVNTILPSAVDLLHHIRTKYRLETQGYFISAPITLESDRQLDFIKIQATIIDALRSHTSLQAFILHIPNACDPSTIKRFAYSIPHWTSTNEHIEFTEFGDSIDTSGTILFGIHTGVTGSSININFIRPPKTESKLADHIYKPFNDDKYIMSNQSSASDDEGATDHFEIRPATPTSVGPNNSIVHFHLIRKNSNPPSLVGTNIYSIDGPTPPLDPHNFNPFHRLFGVTFKDSAQTTRTRIIPPYEYCQCWQMDRNLIVDFARDISNIHLLENAIPAKTSLAILDTLLARLTTIRLETSSFIDSSTPTAPAAIAFSFLSGATTLKLPTIDTWRQAYQQDDEMKSILAMINNPSTIKKDNLSKTHYVYRQPLRNNCIKLIDGLLYIQETMDISENFMQLQIVPAPLRNIIFIAFHVNPIGEHFGLYHTFHKIRLRYFWPCMYKYIDYLIKSCAGCNLIKSKIRKSSALAYPFPIDQPWVVLHADVYTTSAEQGFSGEKSFMNVLCGMCTFCAVEGLAIDEMNSNGFAKAIM